MRLLMGLLLVVGLCGCSPSMRFTPLEFGDATGVYTSGNLRMVTERPRIQPANRDDAGRVLVLPTLCTEPSPDYAIAFNQTGTLTANVTGQGSGSATVASAESIQVEEGRVAGVLGLRDGLYAACQSYVNGVIGHDAYALILSQYGRQLSELMHGVPPSAAETPDVAKGRAKQAAFAALLVSCISQYDQTRIGGETGTAKNPVLNRGYCLRVMRTAAAVATRS